jgi:hypothetical protein
MPKTWFCIAASAVVLTLLLLVCVSSSAFPRWRRGRDENFASSSKSRVEKRVNRDADENSAARGRLLSSAPEFFLTVDSHFPRSLRGPQQCWVSCVEPSFCDNPSCAICCTCGVVRRSSPCDSLSLLSDGVEPSSSMLDPLPDTAYGPLHISPTAAEFATNWIEPTQSARYSTDAYGSGGYGVGGGSGSGYGGGVFNPPGSGPPSSTPPSETLPEPASMIVWGFMVTIAALRMGYRRITEKLRFLSAC